MFSDSSGSCLNFVLILDTNCFLTSYSSNASHLILQVAGGLQDFLLFIGFTTDKKRIARGW